MHIALKQDTNEARRFFSGFANAMQVNPSSRARTTPGIYTTMVVRWREIEKLENYSQLYEWLCRIFGSHLVGKQNRIEKMCQRFGLHFRGRGRPRKPVENPTPA